MLNDHYYFQEKYCKGDLCNAYKNILISNKTLIMEPRFTKVTFWVYKKTLLLVHFIQIDRGKGWIFSYVSGNYLLTNGRYCPDLGYPKLKPNSCTYPFSKKGCHHFSYSSAQRASLTDDSTDIQTLRANFVRNMSM